MSQLHTQTSARMPATGDYDNLLPAGPEAWAPTSDTDSEVDL